MLAFWPLIVVSLGVAVGYAVARIANTPTKHVRAVLAACAFGNSTGLPITLLTVIHTNFPDTSDLGHIDPTLFLSVYLLLYPVLQWGVGGWLLAPEDRGDQDNTQDEDGVDRPLLSSAAQTPVTAVGKTPSTTAETLSGSLRHNVLNNRDAQAAYLTHRRGLSSNDEGMYMSELDLASLAREWIEQQEQQLQEDSREDAKVKDPRRTDSSNFLLSVAPPNYDSLSGSTDQNPGFDRMGNAQSLVPGMTVVPSSRNSLPGITELECKQLLASVSPTAKKYDVDTLWEAFLNVFRRCFQPPVVGAVAGIVCAAISPLRGIFVDLENRASSAPLQFLFDGLYSVGLTAVPINMMILGCNLSASMMAVLRSAANTPSGEVKTGSDTHLLPWSTMIGIVVGKMIIMPFIGILLAWTLRTYIWNIPDDIDGSFYLVLMIVFLTPTANNVMVMVELSGSGAKEGIASVIALQYAVAPLILSLTMTIAVGVADGWS